MALDFAGQEAILLYATSVFNFFILKFINDYNLPFDLLVLNDNHAGFWSYKDLLKNVV